MRVWLVLLVLSLALAGCGDKKDTGVGGESFKTPTKEGLYHIITVGSDNDLEPRNAKVPKGAIVEWRIENSGCILKSEDGAIDASTSPTTDGDQYNNGNLPQGSAWRWDSTGHEGEHNYRCSGKDIRGILRVG
ncbi:MAG: hypothetical protein ACPHID_01085 [Thermoplasmatota archaeon]